jgi:hypothetical protein
VRVIGLTWIEHNSRLLALPGSGIESAADLRGKRLALLRRPNDPVDYPRATALRAYLAALASAGLGPDDVSFVDVTIDEPLVGRPPEDGALFEEAQVASSLGLVGRSARYMRVRPRFIRITHTCIVTSLLTTPMGRVNMNSTLTDRWRPS